MTSLGFRNNNPGNIRPTNTHWQGQTGVTDSGYCIFDTPENGIRALAKQLLVYQDVHRWLTVRDMISHWAPTNENDTASYIAYIADWMGVNADNPIDLHDALRLATFTEAIIWRENGPDTYTLQQIDGAVAAALA